VLVRGREVGKELDRHFLVRVRAGVHGGPSPGDVRGSAPAGGAARVHPNLEGAAVGALPTDCDVVAHPERLAVLGRDDADRTRLKTGAGGDVTVGGEPASQTRTNEPLGK
jgi:hypothetical protein